MQQTCRIGDRAPEESLEAAQGRAYSLARSISKLLAEIARFQLVFTSPYISLKC
jgi:hypothetical protein